MRFSERMGFKPVKTIIQVDSMDIELRNGLWNALTLFYWKHIDDNTHFKYLEEVRGYPETLSLHCHEITQHPCGNEIPDDHYE